MSDWTRYGDCNHCGWCCTKVAREVIVRTDEQVSRDPAFYAARGFKPTRVDGEVRFVLWAWLEAPCPQAATRHVHVGNGIERRESRCGIYDARPQTCQDFPRLPVDVVGTPCSYWFETDGPQGRVRVGGTGSPHPMATEDLLRVEQLTKLDG